MFEKVLYRETLDELKKKVSLRDVLDHYGIEAPTYTKHICCPFHHEDTPSFRVYNPTSENGSFFCWGAVHPEEYIWTSTGLKKMDEIGLGSFVLDRLGKNKKITHKESKFRTGIEISTFLSKEPLYLSHDHWCVYISAKQLLEKTPHLYFRKDRNSISLDKTKKIKKDYGLKFDVKLASEIRPQDYFIYPIEKDNSPINSVRLPKYKRSIKGPIPKELDTLKITNEFLFLAGWWVAEGCLYRGGLQWTVNYKKEKNIALKLQKYLKNMGYSTSILYRKDKGSIDVKCSSSALAFYFKSLFKSLAKNKELPNWFFKMSRAQKNIFLKAYQQGDGTANTKTVVTISYKLALGLIRLAASCGNICSLSKKEGGLGKDGIFRQDSYYINLSKKETRDCFIEKINGSEYLLAKIHSIKRSKIKQRFVDISIEGDQTFLTAKGVTHNCSKAGGIVEFVKYQEGISSLEALKLLAVKFNIPVLTQDRVDIVVSRVEKALYKKEKPKETTIDLVALKKYFDDLPQEDVPYLKNKKICHVGTKSFKDSLVIPVYDIDNNFHGIQVINSKGEKRSRGNNLKGPFFLRLGGLPKIKERAYICEGYSTAVSVFLSTGATTYVAFTSRNFRAVYDTLSKAHYFTEFIVAGDNDLPGRSHGLKGIYPDQQDDDWNDVFVRDGADKVAELLKTKIPE